MDNFTQALTSAQMASSGDTATHAALVRALVELESTGPGWPLLVRNVTIEAMKTYISAREQGRSGTGKCYASALDSANEEYRIQLGEDRSYIIWTQKKTIFPLAAKIKALNSSGTT